MTASDPEDFYDLVDTLDLPATYWAVEGGPLGAYVDWPGWPLAIVERGGEITVRATIGGIGDADLEEGDLPVFVLGEAVAAQLGDIAIAIVAGPEEVRITVADPGDLRATCARLAAFAPVAAAALAEFEPDTTPPDLEFDEDAERGPW